MKKSTEKQEIEGKDLETNYSRLVDLVAKKRNSYTRFPDNHNLKNEIEILQNFIDSFEPFIDEYNKLVSFAQSINNFVNKYSIDESELLDILHHPTSTTEQKKTAVLRSTAKTYQIKAEKFEAKYLEIYYTLTRGRIDLAMQKIDDENEKLAFWAYSLFGNTRQAFTPQLRRFYNTERRKNRMKKILKSPLTAPSVLPEQARPPRTIITKSVNDWIEEVKGKPAPSKLFFDLWREGDFCIFFGDSGLGKSLLAVQLAESLAKGGVYNEPTDNDLLVSTPTPILYLDAELSAKQFEMRYSIEQPDKTLTNHYDFSANFSRSELNPDFEDIKEFEKYLYEDLQKEIAEKGIKHIIIDNFTALKTQNTQDTQSAMELAKTLNQFKKKNNVSLLVLGHTPKRNPANAITRNDLAGSANLYNLCDACFAIGQSAGDSKMKYIKQLKYRHGDKQFDSDNVILCEIEKPHNFTRFRFIGTDDEQAHLKTPHDKEERESAIIELHKQGKSNRQISDLLGITHTTVNRKMKKAGLN